MEDTKLNKNSQDWEFLENRHQLNKINTKIDFLENKVIKLEQQIEKSLERFENAIRDYPEVMECYLMTGDADYLLRVVVPDIQALERFIIDELSKIPGVSNIKSSFALKQVKYKTALPLPAQR